MLTEPTLQKVWADWFARRLVRHEATDGHPALAIVRLAADGIWLTGIVGGTLPDEAFMRKKLLAMTRPDSTLLIGDGAET